MPTLELTQEEFDNLVTLVMDDTDDVPRLINHQFRHADPGPSIDELMARYEADKIVRLEKKLVTPEQYRATLETVRAYFIAHTIRD